METVTMKLYEGMFLVDSALAAANWEDVLNGIRTILDKVDAEVISIRKWNECRLAYEINHKSRGTYILVYFRVQGPKVATIEREVSLSEKIMRVLILNVEHMSEEDLQKATPAEVMEKRLSTAEAKITAPVVDSAEEPVPQEAKKMEVTKEAALPASSEEQSEPANDEQPEKEDEKKEQ